MKNDAYVKDTFSLRHTHELFVLERDFVNFHKDDEPEQTVHALWQSLPALFATQNPSPLQTDTAYAAGRMYLLRKHHFSFIFMLVNVFYPLIILPYECLKECIYMIKYRIGMFFYRLINIIGTK